MTRTLAGLAISVLSLMLIAMIGFGQTRAVARYEVAGTWSGIFAANNPDGTVSHNRLVIKLKVDGTKVNGTLGSTIDDQSDSLEGQAIGGAVSFHVSAGRITEFRLHLSEGHLNGHAFGVGENRLAHADVNLQPAPALLPRAELVTEIRDVDRQVFEAYQDCDLSQYASFLSSDLEFYQDNIGVRSRAEILASMKDRCREGIHLLRRLDEKTLVINPIPGYDAVEAGTHWIYSVREGSEHLDATAQFTQIWTKKTGHWQLLRVVSFDHR